MVLKFSFFLFLIGLTELKVLPRPWFYKLQQALLHRYFVGGLMLQSTTLTLFIRKNPISTWEGELLYIVSCYFFICNYVIFNYIYKYILKVYKLSTVLQP